MKFPKTTLILVAFVVLMVFVAACGNSTPAPAPTPAPTPAPSGEATPPADSGAADDTVYTIRYAHNQTEESPQHEGVVAFKERVEAASNGRIKVEIFPNLVLGSMREQAELVQNGSIEMTQQPVNVLSNFAPTLALVDFPFLFDTEETLWTLMDGEIGAKLNEQLYDTGFVSMGYMTCGSRWITTQKKPVYSTSDLKGMTLRVMTAPISISTCESFGANPIAIEYSELYNSLQQGVVDGHDNPVQTIYMLKLWEVQKYVTATNHSWLIYGNVMNKAFYESLPADLQQCVAESMDYANKYQRQLMADNIANYIQEMEKGGMTVIYPDEAQMQTFIDAGRTIYDKYVDIVGKDLLEETISAVDALKK